jgi:putative membrane protein
MKRGEVFSRRHVALCLSIALGAIVAHVGAADTGAAPAVDPLTTSAPDALTVTERSFINEAAGASLYEVAGGQLAASKAVDPSVRAFGSMLVSHNRAAQGELQVVASAHGVVLPADVEPSERAKLDRLSQLSGPAFDREFMQTIGLSDHQATINKFNAAKRDVRDAQLRAWIEKTLPDLQRHLQQAQQLSATR